MLPDVGVVFVVVALRRAICPAIHAASYVDHEKEVVWLSISMHGYGFFPIVMVLRLAAFLGRRSSVNEQIKEKKIKLDLLTKILLVQNDVNILTVSQDWMIKMMFVDNIYM